MTSASMPISNPWPVARMSNFCTPQPITRWSEAYRSSLCVVLPSVYRTMYGDSTEIPELLGQTLHRRYGPCGIPAICTDVASMPEVVEHGVTGFVVPPNNPAALGEKLSWLRDHPLRNGHNVGAAARRHVLYSCFLG